jgi:hypothetical protein
MGFGQRCKAAHKAEGNSGVDETKVVVEDDDLKLERTGERELQKIHKS